MPKTVTLGGTQWRVASGFNLYVDIATACNASCPFCIAPTVQRKDGPGFFEGTAFALNLTESIGGTVQVVGGEPMISHRLPRLLHEIGARRYRRVVVNTNGTFVTSDIVSDMRSARVTHVNVSRHHFDEQRNQRIMHLRPELPNSALALTLMRLTGAGFTVRMQCNIIKGQVDSAPDMLTYIAWCAALGCREISFSQVFPLSLFDYQVPIEGGYAERVQVDLRQLVAQMDACGHFRPVPENQLRGDTMSAWGQSNWGYAIGDGAKRRFWFGPQGAYCSLKTLSGYDIDGLPNETVYRKEEDWELQSDNLAFAVLHSDGRVTASWDRRERLLFTPDASVRSQSLLDQSRVAVMV